jgi:sarcosine oxidase subunit beta
MAAFRHQWSIEAHVAFSRYSGLLYEEFADQGRPVNFRHNGYLFLYEDEEEMARARRRVEQQEGIGVEGLQLLAPPEIAEAVPCGEWIDQEGLAGAVFGARDGFLDPLAVAQAFLEEARNLGVDYRSTERVVGFDIADGRVVSLRTVSGERHAAGLFLNAAGPWSIEIAGLAGVDLPVRPAKRYLYQTRPILGIEVSGWPLLIGRRSAHFRPAEGNTLILACEDRPETLTQIPGDDGLWENQDRIEPGFGLGPDEYGIEILAALAERVPVLAEHAALAHVTCGWYSITPDHKAILSADPRLGSFFHATGFSGHGIMHAAATGLCMAELLLERPVSLVSPEEFARHFSLDPLLEGRRREPVEEMVL